MIEAHEKNIRETKRYELEKKQMEQEHYRSMFLIDKGMRNVKMSLRNIKTTSGYCHLMQTLNPRGDSFGAGLTTSLRKCEEVGEDLMGNGQNLIGREDGQKDKRASSSVCSWRRTAAGKTCISLGDDYSLSDSLNCCSEGAFSKYVVPNVPVFNRTISTKSSVVLTNDRMTRGKAKLYQSEFKATDTCVKTVMTKTAIKEGLKKLVREYNRPRCMTCIEMQRQRALTLQVNAFIKKLTETTVSSGEITHRVDGI